MFGINLITLKSKYSNLSTAIISPVMFLCTHSGAVTVVSADEVTGVWSINHILQLSSQQVAGTELKGEGLKNS